MGYDRIVLITSEFPPGPGGIGNHADNLARGLAHSGRDVTVLTNERETEFTDALFTPGSEQLTVIRVPRYRVPVFTYIRRVLEALRLGRGPVSCFIASGKFSLWLCRWLKRVFPRHRYVAVIHGSEIRLPSRAARKRTLTAFRSFDQLVAVSGYTKGLLNRLDPNLAVKVIPNGFDPGRLDSPLPATSHDLNEPGKRSTAPVLLTVGRVSERKGQQNVVACLPWLIERYPEVRYDVVGESSGAFSLLEMADRLGVLDHVVVYGVVPDDKLSEYYRRADICLMLAEETRDGDVEGFGIAAIEANYLGLPVIGAKDSGLEEAVRDGFSGLLVDPHQPEAVVSAIENILGNPKVYSDRAREWSGSFRWGPLVERYLAVIDGS